MGKHFGTGLLPVWPNGQSTQPLFYIMKTTSLIIPAFAMAAVFCAMTVFAPVFAEDADMLNKAFDLVHQAWNPGGDPLSNEQRTDLLNQALKLTQDAPQHHVKGHRVQAVLDIKAALDLLKDGDPDNKAVELIHDASDQLREALRIAE
jgi:hypothetical protein